MKPSKFINSFAEAIQSAQPRFLLVHPFPDRFRMKLNVLPRFSCLPLTPWTFFERIPMVGSLGRLLSLRGTVIRTGAIKMQEYSKEWECSRCKTRQFTFVDDHQFGAIPKPITCIGIVDDVPCKKGKFNQVRDSETIHVDYQEVKIQELTSVLDIGAVPRSILILLRYELVDQCRAGDDVIVTGILGCRTKANAKDGQSRMIGELFLQVTSIQSTTSISDSPAVSTMDEYETFGNFWKEHRDNEIGARSIIVNSFCPQMHGMFLVKLATLMTIIGGSDTGQGWSDEEAQGARRSRKEGHLLLVGDPGKGQGRTVRC